ncbi:polysaccharide biosynthesis tyrosine autokinase [Rhizobium puerariae]|uniref:non-specific protein-tyrosine kinase n=1 Tax=Rhizobium puerariae TaxID=1585791 RepID=A0ABV6AIA6_9HYPH
MRNDNKAFLLNTPLISEKEPAGIIDFDRWLGVARRQWLVAALCTLAAACLGIVYALTAVPVYTARASVLIDTANTKVAEQFSSFVGMADDEASILSQVELLRSQAIGAKVVDDLKLVDNPEFMAEQVSTLAMVKRAIVSVIDPRRWFSPEEPVENADEIRQDAIDALLDNLGVSRVGRTYVLEVSYSSPSPGLAASIANAVGQAYLRDKLDSKYDATRRASAWLEDRIGELRKQALESDLAVQRFRADKGLVSAGSTLVMDQQLSELNTALITAQSETAQARAKYERIQQIISSNTDNDSDVGTVTDLMSNTVYSDLRQKYLDAWKRETDISRRFGEGHVQAIRLRNEMSEYRRLMFAELQRVAEGYKSELDVAEAREKSISDNVDRAANVSATANETQVQLRELERQAQTYRSLYEAFLQRYQEATQQQSFPITDARVISRATAPTSPSAPNKPLVVLLFSFIGAIAGAGFGGLREFRDRFFRTGDQIRDELNVEFLGIVPLAKRERQAETSKAAALTARSLSKNDAIYNYAVDHPLSGFAETLRSAKIATDLSAPSKNCRIIGIVSTLPGEGKSTIAVNFAELLASQGARTVLIDADLRNPGATRAIAQHADKGILQVLVDELPIRDALLYNEKTHLAFLPAVIRHRVSHSSELLTSAKMQNLLSTLSGTADYIILDLPPLGPVIDARAIASSVHGFLMVVEWGKTSRRAVRQTLGSEGQIKAKCVGAILNKVDQQKLKLYHAYGSSEYYYSSYSQYYVDKE